MHAFIQHSYPLFCCQEAVRLNALQSMGSGESVRLWEGAALGSISSSLQEHCSLLQPLAESGPVRLLQVVAEQQRS